MTITAHLAVSSAESAARFYRDAFGARRSAGSRRRTAA